MKFILLLLLVCACSSDKPEGRTQAEVLFKEAEDLIKAERYILATEKLNEIKTRTPRRRVIQRVQRPPADGVGMPQEHVQVDIDRT